MEINREIDYFDCDAMVGRRQIRMPESYDGVDSLLGNMDSYGIGRAVVRHSMSVGFEARAGNALLMEAIKGHDNLCPMWMALPHHAGDFPRPEDFAGDMRASGVKMITVMPREFAFTLSDWCSGPLLNMLEEARVPLLLPLPETNWEEIREVLEAHPALRLIITDLHYNCARRLYPLLEAHRHLYIETIGYKVFGGIEAICSRFGPERLVFGTHAPIYSGGAAIGMISYARISVSEKRLIAAGNLERLMGEARL